MRIKFYGFIAFFVCFNLLVVQSQPNWTAIKNNASSIVHDTTYDAPYIQPLNVGGWEDGLYITREGRHLYSTYLPVDVFSWLYDLVLNPVCLIFHPIFVHHYWILTPLRIFGTVQILCKATS